MKYIKKFFGILNNYILVKFFKIFQFTLPIKFQHSWVFNNSEYNPNFLTKIRIYLYEELGKRNLILTYNWYYGIRILLNFKDYMSRSLFVSGGVECNEFYLLNKLLVDFKIIFDIGAHHGTFSLFSSYITKKIQRFLQLNPAKENMNF